MTEEYTNRDIDDYCRVFTEEDFPNDDKNNLKEIKKSYNDFVDPFDNRCNEHELNDYYKLQVKSRL